LHGTVNKFSEHLPPQHTTQQPLLPVKIASNSVICSRQNQHHCGRDKTNYSFAAAIAQRYLRPFRLRGQRRTVQLELPHSPGYGAATAFPHRTNVAFECFSLGDV
jgi:hypothetical protein